MTITNQTNPVGTAYTSSKSYIAVPREGNIFIKETTYTTLRLTKTTNNPPTYRKEIFQHESAKNEGNVVQIGVVNDKGEIEFNSQLDTGNGNEELMKEQIQKQLKTQTKDAEKQIKDKVNADTKALNKNKASTDGNEDSKDSPKTKTATNKGIARKNYGTLFYPSFIQKSNQDKLKITILEFSSRFKGGKNDPKKLSKLENVSGKPKRSDYGTNRNERGSYLRALRKYKQGKGKTNLTESSGSALSLDNRKRLEVDKRLVGHITLPIPDGVTDQNKVNFGSGTLNALQVGGAELALDFLLRGAKQAGETAGDVFKQAVTDKNVQQAIAALLAGSGIGVETNDLLARTQGNINNNNLELLIQRPYSSTF
jgi:hypothetical protein